MIGLKELSDITTSTQHDLISTAWMTLNKITNIVDLQSVSSLGKREWFIQYLSPVSDMGIVPAVELAQLTPCELSDRLLANIVACAARHSKILFAWHSSAAVLLNIRDDLSARANSMIT